jgi:LDH2 family malate/lactate/ureidoglycolate dehydrogenase
MFHIKTRIERPPKELIGRSGMLSGSAFGRGVKSFHQLTGPTGVGALTLAINVERFMPLAQFRNLMKAKGTARIYLPGEIESEKEKMGRERGIELSAASLKTLNQLLEKVKSPMRL